MVCVRIAFTAFSCLLCVTNIVSYTMIPAILYPATLFLLAVSVLLIHMKREEDGQ